MAEQHLDDPDVGVLFQKVCGETVANNVWGQIMKNPDFSAVSCQGFPERLPSQLTATRRYEKKAACAASKSLPNAVTPNTRPPFVRI